MILPKDFVVVEKDIAFLDSQVVVQNLEELAFNSPDILGCEAPRAYRPMFVAQCGIVAILVGKYQAAKENMLVCTSVVSELKIRLRS